MLGLAGKGNGQKNAEETARFINRTEPDRIINFTIFLHREAPLWREIERGTFVPADEYENLLEERSLIEQIGDFSLLYDGFHDNIKVRTRGKLPEDREKMLIHLDRAAERLLYEKRNKKKD